MTEPSEAALRKACEVLSYDSNYRTWNTTATSSYERGVWECIYSLARHFDAEDRLAREYAAMRNADMALMDLASRHILPDPKPTVADIVEKFMPGCGPLSVSLANALRDAGLLRE